MLRTLMLAAAKSALSFPHVLQRGRNQVRRKKHALRLQTFNDRPGMRNPASTLGDKYETDRADEAHAKASGALARGLVV